VNNTVNNPRLVQLAMKFMLWSGGSTLDGSSQKYQSCQLVVSFPPTLGFRRPAGLPPELWKTKGASGAGGKDIGRIPPINTAITVDSGRP